MRRLFITTIFTLITGLAFSQSVYKLEDFTVDPLMPTGILHDVQLACTTDLYSASLTVKHRRIASASEDVTWATRAGVRNGSAVQVLQINVDDSKPGPAEIYLTAAAVGTVTCAVNAQPYRSAAAVWDYSIGDATAGAKLQSISINLDDVLSQTQATSNIVPASGITVVNESLSRFGGSAWAFTIEGFSLSNLAPNYHLQIRRATDNLLIADEGDFSHVVVDSGISIDSATQYLHVLRYTMSASLNYGTYFYSGIQQRDGDWFSFGGKITLSEEASIDSGIVNLLAKQDTLLDIGNSFLTDIALHSNGALASVVAYDVTAGVTPAVWDSVSLWNRYIPSSPTGVRYGYVATATSMGGTVTTSTFLCSYNRRTGLISRYVASSTMAIEDVAGIVDGVSITTDTGSY